MTDRANIRPVRRTCTAVPPCTYNVKMQNYIIIRTDNRKVVTFVSLRVCALVVIAGTKYPIAESSFAGKYPHYRREL